MRTRYFPDACTVVNSGAVKRKKEEKGEDREDAKSDVLYHKV